MIAMDRHRGMALLGCWLVFLAPVLTGKIEARAEVTRPVEIRIQETGLARGDHILLGEVSKIRANDFLTEALEKISLGKSPRPGKVKVLKKRRIVSMVRSHRIVHEGMEIFCPERVYVKRPGLELEIETVKEQVTRFLARRFKNREFKIQEFNVRGLGVYPSGKMELAVESRRGARPPIDTRGRLFLSAEVKVDGESVGRLRITGQVAVYDQVLCASRPLEKGELISKKDVCFEKRNVLGLKAGVFSSIEDVIGKRLTRGLGKGSPFDEGNLVTLPTVVKGDIVTLVARKNNLCIVATGVCRQDGYADDLIRVENIRSGKTVRGVVRKDSTVEIVY